MNILERAGQFVQRLVELRNRTSWQWRQCIHCGSTNTTKYGHYARHPWTLHGREEVSVQRHRCKDCGKTYAEESPELIRRSWYSREVHRAAIDWWQFGGSSLRRVAEIMRSLIGRQERWLMWHPLAEPATGQMVCELSASTLHEWLKKAGRVAQQRVSGHMRGIFCSGEMGTDGLWARLHDGSQRVVLMLTDYVTGLIYPPVVADEEASWDSWAKLFARVIEAGGKLAQLNGITSDGAQGLVGYLRQKLSGVHQQRCVWHLWRSMGRQIARHVGRAMADQSPSVRKEQRQELQRLLGRCLNASSNEAGEEAMALLAAHSLGEPIAKALNPLLDSVYYYLLTCHAGLCRVGPEWLWRDFRQRQSRGRNHGSEQRLEQALLVWAIYRNFEPAQRRSERKRHYRHPGQSPLEVAGAPPGRLCYLDALQV